MIDLDLKFIGQYAQTSYKGYNIFVIGTGATGSNLIPQLTQLSNNFHDKVELHFIDGDFFEHKNLKNQKCTILDMNRSKSEVLAERYSRVYPNLKIHAHNQYVYSEDDIYDILGVRGQNNFLDIMIGCVDNNATRKIMHKFYKNYLRPLIYIDAGNGTDDMEGQVVTGLKLIYRFGGKAYSSSVLKPVAEVYPEILEDNDEIKKILGCSEVVDESPQNIGTNTMSATAVFTILNQIISFNRISSHIVNFNAILGTMRSTKTDDVSLSECYEKIGDKIKKGLERK